MAGKTCRLEGMLYLVRAARTASAGGRKRADGWHIVQNSEIDLSAYHGFGRNRDFVESVNRLVKAL